MKPTRVLTDDDAVSPVIGVILMVAITVVMAAITGAFVLSLQNDVSVSPTTSWDTSSEDANSPAGAIDNVRLLHRAGDTLNTEQLSVRVAGQQTGVTTTGSDGQVRVGDVIEVTLDDTDGTAPAGDELLLVWTPESSDNSVILTSHRFLTEYEKTLQTAEAN